MSTLQGGNTVGAYEAKTHLSELLEKVEAGEEITITKHGAPVALLLFRQHRPPEGSFAILDRDFNVASVDRETLIAMDRFSDFLRDGAVRGVHILLIRGWAGRISFYSRFL